MHKTFGRAKTIALALSLLAVFATRPAMADDSLVVFRQAIVGFDTGVVVLPEGQDSATLQEVTITVPEIETVLAAHGTEMVTKAFPSTDWTDSILVSPLGDTVRLPDLRGVLTIRFPTGTDIDVVLVRFRPVKMTIWRDE